MQVVAFPTPNLGFRNQLLGAVRAVADLQGAEIDENKCFLLPEGVDDIQDLETYITPSKYKDAKSFRTVVGKMLARHIKSDKVVPKIVIMVYDATGSANSGHDLDLTARAIKDYYAEHNLGSVLTAVVSSRFYKYRYVDIVNIPKFLLTFYTRMRLFESKSMRKKTLVTVGLINNFNRQKVQQDYKKMTARLRGLQRNKDLADHLQKLKYFIKADRRVVFCLGGRVEGREIIFDMSHAARLLTYAERLAKKKYAVMFVNGPRTPNDVIDYLYEKTKTHSGIVFHNCKRLAQDENATNNWRLYFGQYTADFRLHEKIGNIYPGVLGYENTLVVHTFDTYAACETASAALPTSVAFGVPYVDQTQRYDCYNLHELLCPKYAIDLETFINAAENMNMEPRNLQLRVLSNPLRVFAETVINRLNGLKK